MKRIILLLMCMLLCIRITNAQNAGSTPETDFYSPIKAIVKEQPEKYKELLQRFCNVDTNLTPEELKTIYYGYSFTPDYNPYESYNAIYEALENKDYEKALLLCEIHLSKSPVSLYLLVTARNCAIESGQLEVMAKYHVRYRQLLDVIKATGTGKNIETAYKVLSIPDETQVLKMLHQMEEKVSQKLLVGNYDVITIKSAGKESDVYFDVNRLLERLKEQMNKDKLSGSQDVDYFSKFPQNTIFYLSEPINSFTPLVCEVPGKTNDTVWVEDLVQPPLWEITEDMKEPVSMFTSKFILKHALYPQDAIKKGIEGQVQATCIVEKDGSLTDIKIVSPVFPSIDSEVHRLLSETKLLPCQIGDIKLRCRHNISLSFEIRTNRGEKQGKVYLINTNKITEGIAKTFYHGVRWTQTFTQTKTNKYGQENRKSWTIGSWQTFINIDIPQNEVNLERILCKILYNRNGNSVEAVGPKYAKKFGGKIKNEDFKGVKGDKVSITAKCLSYKEKKYYSYGYKTTLQETPDNMSHTVEHNFIYDIQAKRLLTITDILTAESIMAMGMSNEEKYDLGLNDYFLYIGKKGEEIETLAITQENWHKFSPMFQALLGDKQSYPISINKDNFQYDSKLGIQPEKISQKIFNKPSLNTNEDFYQHINKNIVIPESIVKSRIPINVNMSFVIEKDGTISNLKITQSDGDTALRDKLIQIFNEMPQCIPLTLSYDGAVRTYNILEYRISFNPKKKNHK